jgi:hypothetical protein
MAIASPIRNALICSATLYGDNLPKFRAKACLAQMQALKPLLSFHLQA